MNASNSSRPTLEQRDQAAIEVKLQAEMDRRGVDALILTEASTIYYATGHLSTLQVRANRPGYALAVVLASGRCKLICPDYEYQSARSMAAQIDVIPQATGIYIDNYSDLGAAAPNGARNATVGATQGFEIALKMVLGSKVNPVIGIQRSLITADALSYLDQNAGGATFLECAPLLDRARAIKTPWEVDVLRTAAQMCERVMNATGMRIYDGMPEGELMQLYAQYCFEQGPGVSNWTNAHSFGTMFAPTVLPRDIHLKAGDIVRFDTGPDYLGYISDIARVFCVGTPSDEARRLYDALVAGYRHALSMIGPGVRVADVFRETQETVRRSGIPSYNRGHVGHSIGTYRLGEEWPYISPTSDAVFEVGMVLAVETPYNNPAIGGLCPEDNIVITPNGYEMFTRDPLKIVEV
jgi:Xaa-Pro dipeptidase